MRHLSRTHTLLLNKFNVVAHHLICVTRDFEQQTEPLSTADLEATWTAMQVTHVTQISTVPLGFVLTYIHRVLSG